MALTTRDSPEAFSSDARSLLLLITVVALAIIAASLWNYLRERTALETVAKRELTAIASFEATQIENWRSERLGDGRVLQSADTEIALRVLSSPHANAADRADLLDIMRSLESQFFYAGVALITRKGEIKLDSNTGSFDRFRLAVLGEEGSRMSGVSLEDLYWDTTAARPFMALLIPVQSAGAFVLLIDPRRFLYPMLKNWPLPVRSAETFLFRRDGGEILYLSDLQFHPGAALRFRRRSALPHVSLGEAALGSDYRGTDVLQAVYRVAGSPWYVAAKMDVSDAVAPVKSLGWAMALILVLIALLNIAAAGFISRDQQMRSLRNRQRELREMANETPAYLWTVSPDGLSMFINRPLAMFVGTGAQDQRLRGTWRTFVHPDDEERVADNFFKCFASASDFADEHRLRRFDGEYRWVTAKGQARIDADRHFAGYSGSFVDITEHKQAEENLRAANLALAEELEERARAEKQIQALSAELLIAQEEERSRLARELHDDVGQQVAALNMGLSNLKRSIPFDLDQLRAQTERIRESLIRLADVTRRMAHQLHPAVLEHCSLDLALQSLCSEFTNVTALRVNCNTTGSFPEVPPAISLCAYRVTQEALQNVLKHAKTDSAWVTLTRSDDFAILSISDRGQGMSVDERKLSRTLGLRSMQERTRSVGATFTISSKPEEGTTVTAVLPLVLAS